MGLLIGQIQFKSAFQSLFSCPSLPPAVTVSSLSLELVVPFSVFSVIPPWFQSLLQLHIQFRKTWIWGVSDEARLWWASILIHVSSTADHTATFRRQTTWEGWLCPMLPLRLGSLRLKGDVCGEIGFHSCWRHALALAALVIVFSCGRLKCFIDGCVCLTDACVVERGHEGADTALCHFYEVFKYRVQGGDCHLQGRHKWRVIHSVGRGARADIHNLDLNTTPSIHFQYLHPALRVTG